MKKLWFKISPKNLISGFQGSGLWPLNRYAIYDTKSMDSEINFPVETSSDAENVHSPRKLLRESIVSAIAQPVSKETANAFENSKWKRARVQAKSGEVLTTPEVAKWLKGEMRRRENRKENANEQTKMRNCYTITVKGRTYQNSAENIVSSSDNESDDDENDDTACLECKQ